MVSTCDCRGTCSGSCRNNFNEDNEEVRFVDLNPTVYFMAEIV